MDNLLAHNAFKIIFLRDMNSDNLKKHTAQIEFIKKAIKVDVGGRVVGLINRLTSFFEPSAYILPEAYRNILSEKSPEFKRVKEFAEKIQQAADGEIDKRVLEELQLYTGGPDIINDIIFLKDKDKPWYKRLGGRVWHLPYNPIHKTLHTLIYPFQVLNTLLPISAYYSPITHSIVKAESEPAVLLHELGHALEYGRDLYTTEKMPFLKKLLYQLTPLFRRQAFYEAYSGKGKVPSIPVKGLVFNLLRSLSAVSPPAILSRERLANVLSYQILGRAVEKGLIDKKEALKIVRKRSEILPAAYSSYVLATSILPFLSLHPSLLRAMQIGGMGITRGVSHLVSKKMSPEDVEKSLQEAARKYLNMVAMTEGKSVSDIVRSTANGKEKEQESGKQREKGKERAIKIEPSGRENKRRVRAAEREEELVAV